jgi:hypothetical protein
MKSVTVICVCPVCKAQAVKVHSMEECDIDEDMDLDKDIIYLVFKICASESGVCLCPGKPPGKVYTEEMYDADIERLICNGAEYSQLASDELENVSSKLFVWKRIP